MPGQRLPTKEQIRRLTVEQPELASVFALAEAQRKYERQTRAKANKKIKNRKKRQPAKKEVKATDYLIPRQIAQLARVLYAPGGRKRTRADLNLMLVVLMIETGLRVSEVCDLKLKCLPTFHGKRIIQVLDGKGQVDRTVGLSAWFAGLLAGYVSRYQVGGEIENYLFPSEQGGRLSRWSVARRVKRIGTKAGLWVYNGKDGSKTSKLSPHKFRHTSACSMLNATGNLRRVNEHLGHAKMDTTNLYAKTELEQRQVDLDKTSAYSWTGTNLLDPGSSSESPLPDP